jgi:death-on-curing protein
VTEAFAYLDVEDLLHIAERMLGSRPLVRDLGALGACAARPQTMVFGEDAYPSLPLKAAALLHSIARNQPLVAGNERLGWTAARTMCAVNGFNLRIPEVDAAEDFVLQVAQGLLDVEGASKVIVPHLKVRQRA